MIFQIRSPKFDRESIDIPAGVWNLSKDFNGSICSPAGDEYVIKNNIIYLLEGHLSYTLAQQSNHLRPTASLYENIWRNRSLAVLTGETFPIEKEKDLLQKWLKPKPGQYYLDVGCSTALYARTIQHNCPDCYTVAVDFSTPMLKEARKKTAAENSNILLMRADARKMPFFADTFDGLAMGGTLNELHDAQKVLYECRRILKKNGRFFMMHLVSSNNWLVKTAQAAAGLGGISFWTVKESNELFERSGFLIREQFVKGIVSFSLLEAI